MMNLYGDKDFLWYLVGLVTADGSLSRDGRHVDITLKDRDFLVEVVEKMGIKNKVSKKRGGTGAVSHRVQISNKKFYNFLLSIGLMPEKSLKIEKVKVSKGYFRDFLRGVIDGDGSIRRWNHPDNGCEQWSLRIFSGSKSFVEWLAKEIEREIGARGKLHINSGNSILNRVYVLKFGKIAAKEILRNCYENTRISLERKSCIARECFSSDRGWSRSKTICCVPG